MSFTLDLPSEPGSIARARRALERIEPTLDEATRLNLRLVVSEVVTNAIRHVPAGHAEHIHVTVARTDGRVRVEVVDHGPGFVPSPCGDAYDRVSGWGLNIVAKVATRWGVENDRGARVWFELAAPSHDAAVA